MRDLTNNNLIFLNHSLINKKIKKILVIIN